MKPDIHPQWYPESTVLCACGNTWKVGATVPEFRTDVCSKCHPFFTGEQRIVDTEGQVDRFMRRLRAREEAIREAEQRQSVQVSPTLAIADLKLPQRFTKILREDGIETVADLITRLETGGDEALTDIKGFGLKALADLKKTLRGRGYVLPGDTDGTSEPLPATAA